MDSFVIGFSLIGAVMVTMVIFMNRESKKLVDQEKTEEEEFQEYVDKFL